MHLSDSDKAKHTQINNAQPTFENKKYPIHPNKIKQQHPHDWSVTYS